MGPEGEFKSLTPGEQIKAAQRAEITKDRAHDAALGVEQDKDYTAKGKAIEVAEKIGLTKEQVDRLRSDRARYAEERSDEIEEAWDKADKMIAEALSSGRSYADINLFRSSRATLRNYQDLQDSLRSRLYAQQTTAIREGEVGDPFGTPLIEGLSMRKLNATPADAPEPVERLEVVWGKQ